MLSTPVSAAARKRKATQPFEEVIKAHSETVKTSASKAMSRAMDEAVNMVAEAYQTEQREKDNEILELHDQLRASLTAHHREVKKQQDELQSTQAQLQALVDKYNNTQEELWIVREELRNNDAARLTADMNVQLGGDIRKLTLVNRDLNTELAANQKKLQELVEGFTNYKRMDSQMQMCAKMELAAAEKRAADAEGRLADVLCTACELHPRHAVQYCNNPGCTAILCHPCLERGADNREGPFGNYRHVPRCVMCRETVGFQVVHI